jgi:hypothetical protein
MTRAGIPRGLLSQTLLALGHGEEALIEAGREPREPLRLQALAIVHHGLRHAAESDAAAIRAGARS